MMLFTWACNVLPHAAWLGAIACLPLAVLMLIDRQRRPAWEQAVAKVSLLVLVFSVAIAVWWCRPIFSTVESWTEVKTSSMPVATVTTAQVAAPVSSPVIEVPPVQTPRDWKTILGGLWILGILVFAALHVCAWFRLRWIRHQAIAPPPNLSSAFEAMRKIFGVQARLFVTTHRSWTGPIIIGLWRPVILVPATLLNLDPQEIEMLLRHELAHIARKDAWWNFLALFIETLLFFHPGVWWMTRRLRVTRERLADERALQSEGDRQILARALLNLADGSIPRTVLAARGGELSERIRSLVKVGSPRRPVLVIPALMALAMIIGGFIACGRSLQQKTIIAIDPLDPAIGEIEDFDGDDNIKENINSIPRERLLTDTRNPCRITAKIKLCFLNDQQFQRLNLAQGMQRIVATKDVPFYISDSIIVRSSEITTRPVCFGRYENMIQYAFISSYEKNSNDTCDPVIKSMNVGDSISILMDSNNMGVQIHQCFVNNIFFLNTPHFLLTENQTEYPFEAPLVVHNYARLQEDSHLHEGQTLILSATIAKLKAFKSNLIQEGKVQTKRKYLVDPDCLQLKDHLVVLIEAKVTNHNTDETGKSMGVDVSKPATQSAMVPIIQECTSRLMKVEGVILDANLVPELKEEQTTCRLTKERCQDLFSQAATKMQTQILANGSRFSVPVDTKIITAPSSSATASVGQYLDLFSIISQDAKYLTMMITQKHIELGSWRRYGAEGEEKFLVPDYTTQEKRLSLTVPNDIEWAIWGNSSQTKVLVLRPTLLHADP